MYVCVRVCVCVCVRVSVPFVFGQGQGAAGVGSLLLLHYHIVLYNDVTGDMVCCSVLHCVAVRCSALQRVIVCYSTLQCLCYSCCSILYYHRAFTPSLFFFLFLSLSLDLHPPFSSVSFCLYTHLQTSMIIHIYSIHMTQTHTNVYSYTNKHNIAHTRTHPTRSRVLLYTAMIQWWDKRKHARTHAHTHTHTHAHTHT